MVELEIFKHRDWVTDLLEYYHSTVRGRHNVNRYMGNNLWQKSFFAWCHERYGLTSLTDVVRKMFGTGKYGYIMDFMGKNFSLEILKEYYKSASVMEVE